MNLDIFKSIGEPITKLIETISNGVGTVYKPYAIKREAKAKAFSIKETSRAKTEAEIESMELMDEYQSRMEERLNAQKIRRQTNFDNTVRVAAETLSTETEVSKTEVHPDWTTRLINIVEDISDKEMQVLWGKILAGEVKQPGSYSLRTLEVLRNITKREAELFSVIANLSLYDSNIPNDRFAVYDMKFLKEEFNISLTDTLLLVEAGLIYLEHNHTFEVSNKGAGHPSVFTLKHGNKAFVTHLAKDSPTIYLNPLAFTTSGAELCRLIKPEYNENYIQLVAKKINIHNKDDMIKVTFGDLVEPDSNEITNIRTF